MPNAHAVTSRSAPEATPRPRAQEAVQYPAVALLGATERRRGRGVPSAIPAGLAATSLLLAIGVLLGKGSISPTLGDAVGVEIGLILGLITAAAQTIVLGMALASRHDNDDDYDNQLRR